MSGLDKRMSAGEIVAHEGLGLRQRGGAAGEGPA